MHFLLTDLRAQFPAVVLLGPRQAGKTTLAFEAQSQHPQRVLPRSGTAIGPAGAAPVPTA